MSQGSDSQAEGMGTGRSVADGRARRTIRGQGLLSTLMVLAIVGMVMGMAMPSFDNLLARQRVRSTANHFMTDVNLARSTAIQQGRKAVLCPSADGESCLADGTWHRGWILFDDRDGDREHDAGEMVLRSAGTQQGVTLVTSRMRRRLTFRPTGFSPGSNGTYAVCPAHGDAAALAVIVANNGRARMSETRPGGSPLVCAG